MLSSRRSSLSCALFLFLVVVEPILALAFAPRSFRRSISHAPSILQYPNNNCYDRGASVVARSMVEDSQKSSEINVKSDVDLDLTTTVSSSQLEKVDENAKKYPIDLPSPVLLATSMILAISSIGSLFELLGKSEEPVFGFATTAAIAAIGLPVSLFLLYAAILKATAETEADDEAFLSGR